MSQNRMACEGKSGQPETRILLELMKTILIVQFITSISHGLSKAGGSKSVGRCLNITSSMLKMGEKEI